jgi:hypothetical protein
LEAKPFALLGMNTNHLTSENLKKVMEEEKLPWRSFADPSSERRVPGPIAGTWNILGTPTLYFLDHRGVIRYKWLGSPGAKAIDEALEKLIKEAEGGEKKGAK